MQILLDLYLKYLILVCNNSLIWFEAIMTKKFSKTRL